MLINEVVEDLNDVPENLRENYEEVEGQGFVLKLVKGLKTALTKERENAKTATDALAAAEGVVETRIQTAVQERESQLQDEFRQTVSDEVRKARDEAAAGKKEAAATQALQKAGGNISLMQDKVTSRLWVDENGNTFVASKNGTPELDAEGNAMSVDGLVASLKANPEFAGAFKGTGSAGGGTPPLDGGLGLNGGGGGDKTPGRRSQMTPREKVDFIKENGNDAYQSLPY